MNERSIFFLLFSDACRLNPLKGIYLERKKIMKMFLLPPSNKQEKKNERKSAQRRMHREMFVNFVRAANPVRQRHSNTHTERMSF